MYWDEVTNEQGLVQAAPKDGSGPVRTLGNWYDFQSGRALVVDERHVYWLMRGETQILLHRVDKDGANPIDFSLPSRPDGKWFDVGPIHDGGDAIIIGEHGCANILRAPKDGSPPAVFTLKEWVYAGGTTGLTSDGQLVYCFHDESIYRLDMSTGEASVLSSSFIVGGGILALGTNLYVLNGRPSTNPGNLAVLVLDSGVVRDLGSSFGGAARLLHDPKRHALYWLVAGGKIATYDLEGSNPPELILDEPIVDRTSDYAADEDYLYWLGDAWVRRLKK